MLNDLELDKIAKMARLRRACDSPVPSKVEGWEKFCSHCFWRVSKHWARR